MSKNAAENAKKSKKSKIKYFLDLLLGAGAGLVGGIFGGGGGMLVVPAMTSVNKVEAKIAHATAIAAILPLTIASSVVYGIKGNFDAKIFCYTVVGSIIGGVVGAGLLKKLSNDAISLIFYIVMIIAGCQML